MDDDKFQSLLVTSGIVLFFGLIFGSINYAASLKADCVKSNAHRSAADITVVCKF